MLCSKFPAEHLWVGEFRIVRCSDCDHEWVDPLPTQQQIDAVYSAGYFKGNGLGYRDYFERERASNRRKARYRLDLLQRFGAKPESVSLDIGAADGTFVREAQEAGWISHGVEVSIEARGALEPDVSERIHGSLGEASAVGSFDVVTLWDVLEHMPNIVATMTQVATMLKPGGLVGVVVPVIDNWNSRRRPHTWDQYKPPEHLTFFSTRSLRTFLSAHIGPVIHEEPAWVRYARRTHSDLSGIRRHWSIVRWLEERLARTAAKLTLVEKAMFVDSQLVLCRKR